ncbi:uncharacterized protein L201_004272 [Kwoniella dendrophila CBS 6074]|uniref:BZIP domain-containing protein n=1 Tax=Kwoniella dendrophila CBS 6074 TaxID=1295534 RepID=A0AAX4JV75_9TREE
MDSVLSPKTSAFLNYLNTSFGNDDSTTDFTVDKQNPTSFPPSAFFNTMPVPGRDTPEDTPPSATEETTISPKKGQDTLSASDDSEDERAVSGNRRASGSGVNKRKVGNGHRKSTLDDEDEEDSDSGVSGHEDKKAHNDKADGTAKGKKGGRKSNAGEEGGRGKEPNKAARRKEQNRAAQKAFRERREARVKDLEEKVAELEAKSYGASVENENLRGILKRLQEENISLKQSAFTFSMPVSGNSGNQSQADSNNTSPFNIPRPQTAKPPTPPLSSVDDGLKSINDVQNPSNNSQYVDSPESLVSINSGSGSVSDNNQQQQQKQPDLSQSNAFNAFLFGNNNNNNNVTNNNTSRPNVNPVQSQGGSSTSDLQSFGTQSSSSSAPMSSPSNQSDINALWASLYPQGVEALLNDQTQQQGNGGNVSNGQQPQSSAPFGNYMMSTPFTLLNSQPDFMSFANASESLGMNQASTSQQPTQNQTAFQSQQLQSQPQQQQQSQLFTQPQTSIQPTQTSTNDFNRFAFRDTTSDVAKVTDSMNSWNDITDNSVNDFLAALTGSGSNNLDPDLSGAMDQDDAFNAQLQQIFGGNSPSQLFNLNNQSSSSSNGMNPFSPTNYLNMSPSPLQSQSNGQSPQSITSNNDRSSSYNSPQSSTGSGSVASSASSAPSSVSQTNNSIPITSSKSKGTFQLCTAGRENLPNGISTFGPPKKAGEIVHVVDTQGNTIKPSDLWMRFGMKHDHVVDHLMIDDLCDQMRAKATCNDGRLELNVKDAEMMFRMEGGDDHKARIERMKSRVTNN